ncbi:hypothetical protein SNEBB_007178 [Seison nebaliae]|nr:hypothetical protein SNEBB_007178 [Seison nebaliae]
MAKDGEKKLTKAERIAARQAAQLGGGDDGKDVEDISKLMYGDLPLIQSRGDEQFVGREFHRISDIDESFVDKTVWLRVRIHGTRATGKQCFLVVREKMFTLQSIVYVNEKISKKMVKFISNIPKESLIDVKGQLKSVNQSIQACTIKSCELHVEELWVVSRSHILLPIQIEDCMRNDKIDGDQQLSVVNQDMKLDYRILDLRTPANQAIFRIESAICQFFRESLLKRQFTEIHVPKIINFKSEGGANVFTVSYFKRNAYLAQSPQLYKQMAIASDFERVFTIGPVFRAEDSNTHRHLTEFIGLDLEMVFKYHYHEVLDTISEMFIDIFQNLETKMKNEIELVSQQYPVEPFKYLHPSLRLTFPDAIKLLRENGVEIGDFDDLSTPIEKFLGKLVKEKYSTDFYMLDKYPLAVRPFYTMPDPQNENYSNSYDMFFRGEEIISGAQRIHDPDLLIVRAKKHEVDLETISDYINSFRYGCSPHAGVGIGMERVVMLYLGLENVRKTSMFPRDPKRITP